MDEQYGADFITITDEEGKEFELEILSSVEYEGATYLALLPADADDGEEGELEVSILKQVTEDGEDILVTVDDDEELEAVYALLLDDFEDEEQA